MKLNLIRPLEHLKIRKKTEDKANPMKTNDLSASLPLEPGVVERIMIPLLVDILSQCRIHLITENIYINKPKSAYNCDNIERRCFGWNGSDRILSVDYDKRNNCQ